MIFRRRLLFLMAKRERWFEKHPIPWLYGVWAHDRTNRDEPTSYYPKAPFSKWLLKRKEKRGRRKKRAGFYAVVKITETSTQHAYSQTLLLFKSLNIFKSQPIVGRRYPTGSRLYYSKQIPSRMTSVASSSFIIIRRSVNFYFCYCRCREKGAEPKIISNRPFVEALICPGANPTRLLLDCVKLPSVVENDRVKHRRRVTNKEK